MWNKLDTGAYEGMIAETVSLPGANGDWIRAYWSRPLGGGDHPGIVLIPHMPGWDEWCRETARRFTQHGYSVLCPDLNCRVGTGTPEEVSAMVWKTGLPDDQVMGDTEGCLSFLRHQANSNGKVGVIGMCSGGRHAFMAACRLPFDAAVDCWGGRVIVSPDQLTPNNPVAPIDYLPGLDCPLLGIFGNEDRFPTAAEVDQLEEALKAAGKNYEFHRYEGAGHGIWYYHNAMYRQEAAMDGWNKTFAFFDKYLK